jgi:hypothetical protein
MEPSEIASRLEWLLVIGAWLAYRRWVSKRSQRQAVGLCGRCGKNPPGPSDAASMCSACHLRTQRNYRAGSWLFFGLAGFFSILAPLVVVSDWRRFGARAAMDDLPILVGMAALTAAAGWSIRYFGARVQ